MTWVLSFGWWWPACWVRWSASSASGASRRRIPHPLSRFAGQCALHDRVAVGASRSSSRIMTDCGSIRRVAAQVVSGIGFIGAGAIIFHRQIVRGLTTAASLWAIAGVVWLRGRDVRRRGGSHGADARGVGGAQPDLRRVGGAPYGARLLGRGARGDSGGAGTVRTRVTASSPMSWRASVPRRGSSIGPICCCRRARAARAMLSSSCCNRTRASWWSGSPDGECAGTVGSRNVRRSGKPLGIRISESRAALSGRRGVWPGAVRGESDVEPVVFHLDAFGP